eukprot:TRINITY_DN30417_c0_g1_i1.p3 TRINITY_DN30417_c0_g1~~TRINITY_DN30417_c0_g1_i1.p3  ORF type:complete len:223 (-),score=9.70 TRINITY_DN30417_c0_g1_i1:362-967(-)
MCTFILQGGILLVYFLLVRAYFCVFVPGCGEIDQIKWNNTCYLSEIQEKTSENFSILEVTNMILYDNIFYYLVPPKITTDYQKRELEEKLTAFVGLGAQESEIQFQAVNVSRSPLMFGKSLGKNSVKSVRAYDIGLFLHSLNLRQMVHPQLVREGNMSYASAQDIYYVLCRVLDKCNLNKQLRQSTLLLSTIRNQSRVDWV